MVRLLNCWCSLKSHCLLSLSKAHSGSDCTCRLLGPSVLTQSCWTCPHHGSTKILCLWGLTNTVSEWGGKKWQTCIQCISSQLECMLHCLMESHWPNTSSKIKRLRISRWQKQSIKPRVDSLWLYKLYACESGPGWDMLIGVPKEGGSASRTVHENFLNLSVSLTTYPPSLAQCSNSTQKSSTQPVLEKLRKRNLKPLS